MRWTAETRGCLKHQSASCSVNPELTFTGCGLTAELSSSQKRHLRSFSDFVTEFVIVRDGVLPHHTGFTGTSNESSRSDEHLFSLFDVGRAVKETRPSSWHTELRLHKRYSDQKIVVTQSSIKFIFGRMRPEKCGSTVDENMVKSGLHTQRSSLYLMFWKREEASHGYIAILAYE